MQGKQAGRHFCIFVFGEGSLLLVFDFTRGTRIHANQHESRAYSRLLIRLIAGSRGTLAPSQSARAECLEINPFARADCEGGELQAQAKSRHEVHAKASATVRQFRDRRELARVVSTAIRRATQS